MRYRANKFYAKCNKFKNKLEFNALNIVNRLKEHYQVKSDTDLARLLGVAQTTISSWKSRNTVDFPLIITKCVGIDLNWLVSGTSIISASYAPYALSVHEPTESYSPDIASAPEGAVENEELKISKGEIEVLKNEITSLNTQLEDQIQNG